MGVLKLYGNSTAAAQGLQQSVSLQSAAEECYYFDSNCEPSLMNRLHMDATKQTGVFVRVGATLSLNMPSICQSLEL